MYRYSCVTNFTRSIPRRYNFEVTYAKKIKKKNYKIDKNMNVRTRISLYYIKTSRLYNIPEYYFLVADKRDREKERERAWNFRITPLWVTRKKKKWNKNTLRRNVSRDSLHHSYIRTSTNVHTYVHEERHTERKANETNFIKHPPTLIHLFNKFSTLNKSSSLNFVVEKY